MKRKTLDMVLTAGGGMLVVVLVVAGSLLMWGATFVHNEVHTQLAEQQITFPTAAELAKAKPGTEITPTMRPYLLQYAGQPLVTGAQAEVYADHFIAVHLSEMPYHGVYSKVSAASLANPTTTKLEALTQTVFRGTTLRGLLLEAYAFSKFGDIAFIASVVSFALAGVMLVLTVLGLVHLRRVTAEEQFPKVHREDVGIQRAA